MKLNFIVEYSQATIWTLFVSLLYFARIFYVIRTGVVCPSLMYEVKSTSESPPSRQLLLPVIEKTGYTEFCECIGCTECTEFTEKGCFSPHMIWLVTHIVLIFCIIIVFVLKTK